MISHQAGPSKNSFIGRVIGLGINLNTMPKHIYSAENILHHMSFSLKSFHLLCIHPHIYGDIEILYYHRVEPILVPNALFPRHALAKRTNRELIGTSVE